MSILRPSICWAVALAALPCFSVASAQELQRVVSSGSTQVANQREVIRDIALQNGGVFTGTVVDAAGKAQSNAPVRIRQDGKVLLSFQADANGTFTVNNMKAGVYTVETPSGSSTYRAWAPNTAPPVAQQVAVVRTGTQVVRGQSVIADYGPAIRGAIFGGVVGGFGVWALDNNDPGS